MSTMIARTLGRGACCLGGVLIALVVPTLAQTADNPTVDALFANFTRPGSPGCALGVYRDGKMIYAKGYGLANVESQVPITPASVFDIGSTSKQFTAASILLLEKQGKLHLDDDIRKYLPELPQYSEPGGGTVTILHLLNHTSGVRDYLALFSMAGIATDGVTTDDTALAIIARQKSLNFRPGSEFLYSNSGYFLLSIIVKRVSGQNLRAFAQENIFAPLGMTHTQYRDDHRALIPNRALAYDPAAGGFRLDVSYFEQLGDGAVHTSVEDLRRWDENFYSARVGGKEFLAEIQQRGRLNSGKELDYAKGLTPGTYRGLSSVSHGGSWGGYRAELLRFPAQHFSVACLCNLATANPSRLALETAEVFLAEQMKPKEALPARSQPSNPAETNTSAQPDAAKLASYAGDYSCDELGVVYRLAMADGRLSLAAILDAGGFPRSTAPAALRLTSDDRFAMRGMTLQFSRDGTGLPTGFIADAGRTKGLVFTRVAAGKR
jgi:CubicO group peptidase (beta-lactamase class C family)